VDHDQATMDPCRTDYGAVARCLGYTAIDAAACGTHEGAQLIETARIDQDVDSLPGRQFATAALPLYVFNAPTQAILLLNLMIFLNGLFHSFAHFQNPRVL
jgi:hypothetical protein